MLHCVLNTFLEEPVDSRETGLIVRDQSCCRSHVQAFDSARESEGRNTVDDAEIDGLGVVPLLPRHLIGRNAEHLCCYGPVNVLSLLKSLRKGAITGAVSQDSKLDLRIVGADEQLSGTGFECF